MTHLSQPLVFENSNIDIENRKVYIYLEMYQFKSASENKNVDKS